MKTSTCISHWFLREIDWHDLCTFNLTFNFNICTINRVIHVSRHAFKPPLIFFFLMSCCKVSQQQHHLKHCHSECVRLVYLITGCSPTCSQPESKQPSVGDHHKPAPSDAILPNSCAVHLFLSTELPEEGRGRLRQVLVAWRRPRNPYQTSRRMNINCGARHRLITKQQLHSYYHLFVLFNKIRHRLGQEVQNVEKFKT